MGGVTARLLPVLAALLMALPLAAHAETEQAKTVTAPDFSARSLTDDKVEQLSQLAADKVVLLNFWASWCYPCLIEMPEFQKLYDRFKDQGLTVVAVAVYDEVAPAKAFQDEHKFSFHVLFDHNEEAKKRYFVEVVPQTFLIGRDGKLIPIPNPKTGKSRLNVNDPTVWVQPETYEFIGKILQP